MTKSRKVTAEEKKIYKPKETLLCVEYGVGYVHVKRFPWSRESVVQSRQSPIARIGPAVAFILHDRGHIKWMTQHIPSQVKEAIEKLA